MILGYLGLATGMFLMWVWLTQGSPSSRRTLLKKARCVHCSQVYYTANNYLRTPNYCEDCK